MGQLQSYCHEIEIVSIGINYFGYIGRNGTLFKYTCTIWITIICLTDTTFFCIDMIQHGTTSTRPFA